MRNWLYSQPETFSCFAHQRPETTIEIGKPYLVRLFVAQLRKRSAGMVDESPDPDRVQHHTEKQNLIHAGLPQELLDSSLLDSYLLDSYLVVPGGRCVAVHDKIE